MPFLAFLRRLSSRLLLLSLLAGNMAIAQSVVFINPGHAGEVYWRSVSSLMQAAADSLGMQLEIVYMDRDHTRTNAVVHALLARPAKQRPDYVVMTNDYSIAVALLPQLDQAGIKTFLAFSSIYDPEHQRQLGEPRTRLRHWLGSLEPMAEEIGYGTAQELIEQGRRNGLVAPDGKLHLIAIAGDRSTPSSILRTQGMRQAIEAAGDVVLDQLVVAGWSRERARMKSAWLFDRYPDARLVWAGNDLMAFGAMDMLEERGRRPGKDMLFSAINTSREAFDALREGRLAALCGGHFTPGAWALVMLHDYHHGHDFADEGLALRRRVSMLFTPDEARRFTERFGDDRFDVDFKRFSKVHNPKLRRYDFSLRTLLNAPSSHRLP